MIHAAFCRYCSSAATGNRKSLYLHLHGRATVGFTFHTHTRAYRLALETSVATRILSPGGRIAAYFA